MKDLFGQALYDYYTNNDPEDLYTETSISEQDIMEVSYLFRSYKEMPKIEQDALNASFGKVLDVGCGAGSHSLYLQNEKKLEVTSIDTSSKAIATCKARGIHDLENCNLLDLEENKKFDTILLLMNGTGIFKTLKEAPWYLKKLKNLLNSEGQILIDSSDIIYMYDEDNDGGRWIPGANYYGELEFTLTYKKQTEVPFPWLYLDFETLKDLCESNGLNCEIISTGPHYDYLAKLKMK